MAVPLRPGKSNLLKVGGYNFTMEDVEQIYTLYSDHNSTLWEIKERRFQEPSIKQLAVAVSHGQMDKEKKHIIKGQDSPMIQKIFISLSLM